MKISELLSKKWFTAQFGGLKPTLEKTPDSFLQKELTPFVLSGYISFLLGITEIDIQKTIYQAISEPGKSNLLVYHPEPKLFSNLFLWACWAVSQIDSEKAHQID